ncbi:MAG: glycosyltransferase [Micrococcales bacterium]|nr:glycosyltransferase [Micrococcales bacterium]
MTSAEDRVKQVVQVAVIIPCLNEGATISKVVRDFRSSLPNATFYVYDNGSTDDSLSRAQREGATVRTVPRRGKGHVIRQAFADIDADVYVMVDGDSTYDAVVAPHLVEALLDNECDMVTACRIYGAESAEPRKGHAFGNMLFSRLVRVLFGSTTRDVLSGYRVLSRRFVKSFPITARGFDIEVQMTAQAAMLKVKELSIDTTYHERSYGESKLNTVRDGIRILVSLFRIYRAYSPSRFFGTFSVLSLFTAVSLWFSEPFGADNRYVFSLFLTGAFLFFLVGIILNGITRLQFQQNRLSFLRYSHPSTQSENSIP